jgi:hypothetical protein
MAREPLGASESYHMVQCAIIGERRFSSTTTDMERTLEMLGSSIFYEQQAYS